MMRLICLFSLLLINSNYIFCQKNIVHQNLYWLRYYNQLSFSKKIVWHNEFENRRFFSENRQHHFILHSRLHYKILPNLDIAAGLCYSRQSPQLENATTHLVIPEIRPEQEINLLNTISNKVSLQHRFRADERFIHKNNGTELLPGHDFNWRFRYRLMANFSINKKQTKWPTNLKIANELMVNSGKNVVFNQFDQNRISASLEKGLFKNVSGELGFIHWYQQRPSGKDFFARNIVRVTLLHKIKWPE